MQSQRQEAAPVRQCKSTLESNVMFVVWSVLQKQKQKSSQKPCLPSLLKQVEQAQSSDTPSPSPACADVCSHFKLLEQRKKRGKETPSHTKPKQRSKEPKLQLALNRDYNNYRGREIFIETDTPIFTLPTENMWNIFKRCSSVEDYYQISCVCKKWRSLINSAPLVSIGIMYKAAVILTGAIVERHDHSMETFTVRDDYTIDLALL